MLSHRLAGTFLIIGLSAPRPVLRFDGREVASLGRWYGGVGLALECVLAGGTKDSP